LRRIALLGLAVATLVSGVPASAVPETSVDSPYGREDNPLGTIRWLPRNANESPTATNRFRLVVVYDRSLNDAGQPVALKAKGAFGVKIFIPTVDARVMARSPQIQDVRDFTGQGGIPPEVDQRAMAFAGDVRDGDCAKAGTPAFSAAYSTTRSFYHAGATPYQPISAAGTCEVVTRSEPATDSEGNVVGYETTVTNHVPGFWVDVEWPTRAIPGLGGAGRWNAEVWYGAVYDSGGDPGPFPNGVDTSGSSKSLPAPGDYDQVFSFTAQPGAVGAECVNTGGNNRPMPGTFHDVKIMVPQAAKRVVFKLSNHVDWDLLVFNPNGLKRTSALAPPLDETITAPGPTPNTSTSHANFPDLVPGEYTMRACNFAGEPTTIGGVIIEF